MFKKLMRFELAKAITKKHREPVPVLLAINYLNFAAISTLTPRNMELSESFPIVVSIAFFPTCGR